MLKYNDGTPINVGDRVSFKFCGLSDTATVYELHPKGVDVKLDNQDPYNGWIHPVGGFQAWFVPNYELIRLDLHAIAHRPKEKSKDRYSVGPEGETAGYIARGGGLKFL